VKLSRRAEAEQKHKTLVCPNEEEYVRAMQLCDRHKLVGMPDGSSRVPAEIPTSLDKRCRTVLPNMSSITTWTANPRDWKCTGSEPNELYFPILTKTELGTRLGKFWPPTAVHLRDMDWGSSMRCAFSVEMDGWEEGETP